MPNVGRPSRDCHLCRKRRVKCDLTRPRCLRCGKYGVECPGYRPAAEIVFRNEDINSLGGSAATATGRSQPWSSSSSSASSPSSSTTRTSLSPPRYSTNPSSPDLSPPGLRILKSSSASPRANYHWVPPLSNPLRESLSAHAPPLVLGLYSSRAASLASASSARVPSLPPTTTDYHNMLIGLLAHHNNETLRLAIEAQAQAYLQNQPNDSLVLNDHAWVAASKAYGKALQALNRALRDPSERLRDATLVAVLLLSSYETITASPMMLRPADGAWGRGPAAWFAHARGVASILGERGVDRFGTQQERNTFWMGLAAVQTSYILANQPMPAQSQVWVDAIAQHASAQDELPLAASRYTYDALTITSRINEILCALSAADAAAAPKRVELAAVWGFVDRARELDLALQNIMVKDCGEDELIGYGASNRSSSSGGDGGDRHHHPQTQQGTPFNGEIQLNFWGVAKQAMIKMHHHLILLVNAVEDEDVEVVGWPSEEEYDDDDDDYYDYERQEGRDGSEQQHQQRQRSIMQSLSDQRATSLRIIRSCGETILSAASEFFRAMPEGRIPHAATNNTKDVKPPVAACWADALRLFTAIAMVVYLPSMAQDQRVRAAEALQHLGRQFRIRQAVVQEYKLPPMTLYTTWREDKVRGII